MGVAQKKIGSYVFERLPRWWVTPIVIKNRSFFRVAWDILIRIVAIPFVLISLVLLPFEAFFRFVAQKFTKKTQSKKPMNPLRDDVVNDDNRRELTHRKSLKFIKENEERHKLQEEHSKEFKEFVENQANHKFKCVEGSGIKNGLQLSMAAKDSVIADKVGLYTMAAHDSVPVDFRTEKENKTRVKEYNELLAFQDGVRVWKRLDGEFGHFFAVKDVEYNDKTREIYVIDLRPTDQGLEEPRKKFMEQLLNEYKGKNYTLNDKDEIIDNSKKVVVTVHFLQNQKQLAEYGKVLPQELITQDAGSALCGAVAVVNAIRLSYPQESADRILDGFSGNVFEAFKNKGFDAQGILLDCHHILAATKAAIQHKEAKTLALDPEGSWWKKLSADQRHVLAVHAYLSDYVQPEGIVLKPRMSP